MKNKNLLFTAIAIFGLATITMAQSVPSYVPTNGLVGWWPFNGNANDESGNGNNGTVNGATLTSDRFGNVNKAYNFDGIDDLISIIAQSSIPQQSDYTLSFWFNSPTSTFNGAFVSFGSWFCKLGHDFPGLFYKDEIGNQSNTWYVQQHYNIEPTILTWHQLIIKKTGIIVEILLDNTVVGNITTYGYSNFNPASLIQIGYYCCQNYYQGSLDDFGIWNRALTQQEITALYNGCQLSVNTQPTNQTINVNNNAQFVVGSSDPGATYQWQTDLGVGFQNLNSVGQYSGTANDTLTIANTTLSNNNQPFRCIVSSGSCTDTSAVAVLTVLCNISVTTQPINQSVNISNNAQFTTASSDPLATYQWQTDLGVGFQNLNSVGQYSGTANDTLTIANTTLSNNNQPFRCIISSGACTDTSNVAILSVNNNVGINEFTQDNLFSVFPNPAQSVINVKADSKLIGSAYTIYDNTGRVVLTGKLNSQNTTIELDNLLGGIYLFSFGENLKQTFKVIKE